MLEDLIADVDLVLPCRRLPDDGAKAWAIVEERGFEGFVAKDPASFYWAGTTRSWVKVKVRHEGLFVVDGFRNVDAFDGILVGEFVEDALHFRGVVEWGYRAHDVIEILREAEMYTRRTSPFVDLPRMRMRSGWSRDYAGRSATRRSSAGDCGRRRGVGSSLDSGAR